MLDIKTLIYGFYELLHGRQVSLIWREEIYIPTFIWFIVLLFVFTLFFYQFLTRYWIKSAKKIFWFLNGFIYCLTMAIVAYGISMSTDEFVESFPGVVLTFSLVNFIYAGVSYFFLSWATKRFSTNARHIPF